jgi:phosphoglycerate dehydrogenase-like enzyme
MKVLFTDTRMPEIGLERKFFADAGIELKVAQCKTEDDVIRESEGCAALLITYAQVGDKVFRARPEIGLCSRIGVGFDSINTVDAAKHGVWVANSPDYGSSEVAIHALSMVLSALRHLPQYNRQLSSGGWDAHAIGAPRRLAGLTVGVLGYGRIGSRFAYFAHTMFGRTIACDPHRIDGDFAPYVKPVTQEQLFREADVISIHTPLNDETRGMVNTARGAVINIDDLTPRVGKFEGVGLDVLPKEPIPQDSPLLKAPNVLITPHAAFYTTEAQIEMRTKAAQNIVSWIKNGRPDYPVVVGNRSAPR